MKVVVFFAAAALAAAAHGQTPMRTEGPGLKASEDAREPTVLAACRKNQPPPPLDFAAIRKQIAASTYVPPTEVEGIPGVVKAGAKWKTIWTESGNNADGIVGLPDGSVLVAQQDNSDIVKIDAAGHASVIYRDTNTGGAISISKEGQIFIVERGLNESIWQLYPTRKLLADKFQGEPIDCLGNLGLNDLAAAANGGVYITVGGLYYVAPDGTMSKQGNVSGTNGIILSADEKTLYVTGGGFANGFLVAFDVQPDGSLTNERTLTQFVGGGNGDGSTIDSEGRIYVTSRSVIDVIAPDGRVLGVIPAPKGDDIISVAFGGRGKRTLYAVALNPALAKGGLGLPSDRMKQGGEVIAIEMIAKGYAGRPK
jgi:sugar lactone lactonase YvrE